MDLRRRSPGWVRALPSRELHAIALRFRRQQESEDLTEPQEWLWRGLVSELEYRRRVTRPFWMQCSCELCIPPFPDS